MDSGYFINITMKGGLCIIYTSLLTISVLSSCALFILVVSEALQGEGGVDTTVDLSGLHNVSQKTEVSDREDVPDNSPKTQFPEDSKTAGDHDMIFPDTLSLNSVTTDGNGDLNKPTDGPSGRLRAIAMWQELTNALNLDTTGTAKPVEKWKKVSSPKPPVESTGGLPEEVSPTPRIQEVVQVESIIEDSNRPGESGQSITQPFEEEMVEASVTSPTTHHALSPQRRTGARRAIPVRRLLRSPAPVPPHSARRAPRRHNTAEQFLNSDEHWRNLATQFVTENLRLREIELQQQSQWQTLFAKLIDLIKVFENKINK